eukprot:2094045-Alexandrium_andersonii.AAC.1
MAGPLDQPGRPPGGRAAYCGVLPRTTAYYGRPARPARQAAQGPCRVLPRMTAYSRVLRQARSTSPAGRPAAVP